MKVLITRALRFRGEHVAAGAQLEVEPLDAWELIASGRAALAHPRRDSEGVQKAVQADVANTLRQLREGRGAIRNWLSGFK